MRLLSKIGSLGICGLLGGVLMAAAVMPAATASGLLSKAGTNVLEELPTELPVQQAPQNTYVYASDNKTLLAVFYDENRRDVTASNIPKVMRDAIVAAEDHHFYEHNGVDLKGVARAFVNNNSGGSQQGASTLTMQYVRMVLSYSATRPADVLAASEDTAARKLREMRYAMEVEKKLPKEEILTRYLNIAPFGNGAYGIFAASQVYFGKQLKNLTIEQAALLAGMVKAPTAFDPTTAGGRPQALTRRDYVIANMVQLGTITAAEGDKAKATPLKVLGKRTPTGCTNTNRNHWGFFCDYFYRWWMSQPGFGATTYDRERRLKGGGYRIVTTLDVKTQAAARANIMKRAADTNKNAITIAAIEPGTGKVRALAANRVYRNDSAGNRPHSHPRQRQSGAKGTYPNTTNPIVTGGGDVAGYQGGSTFKVFTTVAALEQGHTLSHTINSPKPYYESGYPGSASQPGPCAGRAIYCPKNASTSLVGTFDMWGATGRSVNTYFVALQERIGTARAVDAARRMGIVFRSAEDRQLSGKDSVGNWGSFTLGVSATTPLDLANAYATLAADGRHCEPTPIQRISVGGEHLDIGASRCDQAVAPDIARAAIDTLRCPVGDRSETSRCVGATAPDVRGVVGKPVAGKTGTTDGDRTASLVVTTRQLAVAGIVADPDNHDTSMRGGGDGWYNPHREAINPAVAETLRDAMKGVTAKEFSAPSAAMIGRTATSGPRER